MKKRRLTRKEQTVLDRLLDTARRRRLRIGHFGYYTHPQTDPQLPRGGGACAIGTGLMWDRGVKDPRKEFWEGGRHVRYLKFAELHGVGVAFAHGLEDVFEAWGTDDDRVGNLRREYLDVPISREDYRSGKRVGRALLASLSSGG